VALPDRPGLGIEIDEDVVRRYAVEVGKSVSRGVENSRSREVVRRLIADSR
jgi:hypothetical protein